MRLLIVLASCLCLGLAEQWMPRELGRFTLGNAGFIEVFTEEDGTNYLYVTTFNPALPFFHDSVYFIKNPGEFLDSVSSWDEKLEQLGGASTAFWPNYPVYLPKEVMGFEGIVQTSGFLVPGKTNGHLEVYDTSSGTPVGPWNIAANQDHDWSYHWVVWKDVDNDGLLDAFTARFRVPLLGGDPIREFVWFKNPGDTRPEKPGNWEWKHFIQISQGPDVYFEEMILEQDGVEYSVIVTSELWSERVMLYYVENIPGAWAKPANIKSVVVDDAPGQPFECHMGDLNNDGKMEIIASAYDTRKGNETGNLWGYEMTGDWTDASGWSRISLASGFIANPYLFGNSMTPGKQRLFYPSVEYGQTMNELGNPPKPWIALSGDDDGVHYIMFPVSEELDNWEYDLQVMVDTEETTAGTMAVVDLDGDGYMEIISAGFTAGTIYVYTFAPEIQ